MSLAFLDLPGPALIDPQRSSKEEQSKKTSSSLLRANGASSRNTFLFKITHQLYSLLFKIPTLKTNQLDHLSCFSTLKVPENLEFLFALISSDYLE